MRNPQIYPLYGRKFPSIEVAGPLVVSSGGDITIKNPAGTTRITIGGGTNDNGLVFGSLGTATRMIDGSSAGLSGASDFWLYLNANNHWRADGRIVADGLNISSGNYIFSAGSPWVHLYSTVSVIELGTRINDDIVLGFGTGNDVNCIFETADSNANELIIALPNGGATEVPVIVVGDQGIKNVDLGWFDGQTIPRLAMVAADEGGYFSHGVDNSDILDIKATTSPVVETDETKFSHKLQVVINGATYYVMLTQS